MFLRFKVFTHRGTQFRLATTFLICFIFYSLIYAAIFLLNFSDVANQTDGMQIHDQLTTKMLLVLQAKQLAIWYGGASIAFGLLAWLFMVVYSHRLTGPVYKLEKVLENCIHNNDLPTKKLGFRKTDAFHELADIFNEFVEKVCRPKMPRPTSNDDKASISE